MAPTKRKETAPKLKLRPAAARAPKTPASIHELEISLCEIEPRIWRRFAVRSNITLAKLHDIVQVVMGWTDSHLHQFVTDDDTHYAPLSPYGDPDWDERVSNSGKVRVHDVLPTKGAQLLYQYDFGDGWEHVIELVDVRPPEPGTEYPRCLAGERACPPEDCGGPYSYPELLAALANPKHPEHKELAEWIGGEFDAEAFDLEKVSGMLAEFR
jgi:hypothetical protein